MKSNYRKIGDFIQLVDERNKELKVTKLLGLSISKQFIPSVANTIGTNMKNYKIIRKNQFACSTMQVRRDKKMPVALLQDFDEAIISQAYPVFEVIDETQLNPEYLMMWFSRSEFDRHACFLAVGGVRGSLEWEDFLEMPIPVPAIEKQRDIVKEYNTIVNRIKLNETLNQKLEDTAQALYKHWFVDFEFPSVDGKPYKSSGGEMVYNAELDMEIPYGWEDGVFGDLIETINGFAFKSFDFSNKGTYPILKIKNVQPPLVSLEDTQFYDDVLNERLERVLIEREDILITMTGSGANQINSAVGQVGRYYFNTPSLLNQRVCKLLVKDIQAKEFVYLFLSLEETHMELLAGSSGSANQANISPDQIKNLKIVLPKKSVLIDFESKISLLFNSKRVEHQIYLQKLKDLLLSKMSKVETKTAEV